MGQRGCSAGSSGQFSHCLYESSVQEPGADIKFLDRIFRKVRGRRPLILREDFCGTAYMCAEWVKSHRERIALGIDLDPKPIGWGQERHLRPLGAAASRVRILRRNVLEVTSPQAEVAVAFNFSYCVFWDRPELVRYFRTVHRGLGPDGLFALDIHGGPEAFEELEEETRHKGFTYVWDQNPVDPISHRGKRYIHFRFPDGTELKRAFTYDWRIWTLPELREALAEAGFSQVDTYWEGFDEDGEGNGVFRKVQKAENDDSWIAYVAAWK